jgi:hypothetical protein
MPPRRRVEWLAAKAEGQCNDVPYDTELVNSNGVSIHFWLGDREPTDELLDDLSRRACNRRDIVRIQFSEGQPTGFWAHSDF